VYRAVFLAGAEQLAVAERYVYRLRADLDRGLSAALRPLFALDNSPFAVASLNSETSVSSIGTRHV
jgi:hypothetical protein